MHACLDDLVIALYVTIDERLEPRRGPGHPPRLADSELICLAVAQVLSPEGPGRYGNRCRRCRPAWRSQRASEVKPSKACMTAKVTARRR